MFASLLSSLTNFLRVESSSDECFEVMDLSNIAPEILANILQFVDEDTLVFSCRLVNSEWKNVVDSLVWTEKCKLTQRKLGVRLPWSAYYWIIKKDPFNENFIKNAYGEKQTESWVIRGPSTSWTVETTPVGSPPVPNEAGGGSCFATSYTFGTKLQVINLSSVGLCDALMDKVQPSFEAGDWICTRFDCGGKYNLSVSVLDEKMEVVMTASHTDEIMSGSEWQKVSVSLCGPYKKSVRYVMFTHSGMDNQFWAGYYGIKITGSYVKAILPHNRVTEPISDSE